MKCIYCDYEAEDKKVCPVCGRSLRLYHRIRNSSAILYNRGVEKARTRDLTGAAEDLRQSLKYYKYNIDARNLLGLVYYEMGELADALGEWVISKSFMPEDNVAGEYLDKIQGNASMLNKTENAVKKYNQAVNLVEHGDLDLAVIQLKRLNSKYKKMVKSHSLLALLYMREGNLSAAEKELNAAVRIDNGNPSVNNYIRELRLMFETSPEGERRSRRKKKTDSGDEPVSVRESGLSYIMDVSKVSVLNIIIGCILGVLVSMFLIFPTLRQRENERDMSLILSAGEEARVTENQLAGLREEIDTLKANLENYEGKSDVKGGYEDLIIARQALEEENMDRAVSIMQGINRNVLESNGRRIYDDISKVTNGYLAQNDYLEAQELMKEEEYQEAIEKLVAAVNLEETLDDGNAMLALATCYESLEDYENAIDRYKRIAELFPEERIGRNAQGKVGALENLLTDQE